MISIFKDILIYGFGGIFNKAINLLLLPLFTAYLTPFDYGIQSMLSFLMLFVGPITNLGIGTSFGICYTDKENVNAKDATIWSSFIILFTLSCIMATIGIFYSNTLSYILFSEPSYGFLITLSAITFIFNTCLFPFNAYLQFEQKSLQFVLISSISAIFNISINCFLVIKFEWGIYGLVWGALLANVFQLALTAVIPFRNTWIIVSGRVMRELVKHGFPMISTFFFLFVLQNSWRFYLEKLQSIEELGIFCVGYNIGSVSLLFLGSLISSWAPYFLKFVDRQRESIALFKQIYFYYYLAAALLSTLFFIYAKFVIIIFTAPLFHSCWVIVGWIALSYLISGGYYLYLPGVYFAKRLYLSNISYILSNIITIFSGYFLIGIYGMMGAAISFFLGHLTLTVSQQILNKVFGLFYVNNDGSRLFKLCLPTIMMLTLSYLPRNLSPLLEFTFATTLISIYIFFVWKLLTVDEKIKAVDLFKYFCLKDANFFRLTKRYEQKN